MAYVAKPDGAWLNKDDSGGTATSNLFDKGDANRWEANMLDANTRLTAVETGKTAVRVDGSTVTTFDVDSTALTAADVGADPAGTAAGLIPATAASHGYTAWTQDPATVTNSTVITAGLVYLCKMYLPATTIIGTVTFHVFTAGVTLVNTFCALFNASGTRLAVSTDQSTAFQSTGTKAVSLSTSPSVPAGYVYAALLVGSAGTAPAVSRSAFSSIVNTGLSAPNFRWCTSGTGLTAIPSTVDLTAASSSTLGLWAAIKP